MLQKMTGFTNGASSNVDREETASARGLNGRPYSGLCALCANCSHRFQCMFPSPAASFWSCEQHKGL